MSIDIQYHGNVLSCIMVLSYMQIKGWVVIVQLDFCYFNLVLFVSQPIPLHMAKGITTLHYVWQLHHSCCSLNPQTHHIIIILFHYSKCFVVFQSASFLCIMGSSQRQLELQKMKRRRPVTNIHQKIRVQKVSEHIYFSTSNERQNHGKQNDFHSFLTLMSNVTG